GELDEDGQDDDRQVVEDGAGEDGVLQRPGVVRQSDEVVQRSQAVPAVDGVAHRLDDRDHDEDAEQRQRGADEEGDLQPFAPGRREAAPAAGARPARRPRGGAVDGAVGQRGSRGAGRVVCHRAHPRSAAAWVASTMACGEDCPAKRRAISSFIAPPTFSPNAVSKYSWTKGASSRKVSRSASAGSETASVAAGLVGSPMSFSAKVRCTSSL